eukprot:COSAG01_NODE_708_length_14125_cov_3.872745_10_plen_78_part_00
MVVPAGAMASGAQQKVSRPFSSWMRSILAEIYLCHACSAHEIVRVETAGQGRTTPRIDAALARFRHRSALSTKRGDS